MDDNELFIGDLPDSLAGRDVATIVAQEDEPTTLAVGEEGGDEPTTMVTGEEGDDEPTTMATGEEGDDEPQPL